MMTSRPAPTLPVNHPAVRYGLTLAGFVLLLLLAVKTVSLETDFTAFLPPSVSPEQRLLITQLRNGMVSRLMLVSLQGADDKTLAQASRQLAGKLGQVAEFEYAANGSIDQFAAQSEVLMRNRFALSPEVNAERFTTQALRAALEERLAQFASPVGVLTRQTLTRDPTGELWATLRQLDPGSMPALRHGVWFSADGQRAFLVVQTRAPGFDSVRQAAAVAQVRAALTEVNPRIDLALTGPGVFAAESHRLIERDAWRLSLCSILVILAMLIFIYRSVLPVVMVVTPVAFGLVTGVLVVQWLFGSVHGITLGFAATLIGEAVDYPNYLLLNGAPGEAARSAAKRIRVTLALAVLTTVASAMALTLSSFTGLAQLGVLTMTGILVAGFATHSLIPWLLGERLLAFRRLVIPAGAAESRAIWPGVVGIVAMVGGAAWLVYTHPAWWETDLVSISPVPLHLRELDTKLRKEMGAPEVSVFLASRGATETAALQAAGAVLPELRTWKQQGWIRGYDSVTWHVPAPEVQSARLASLPDTPTLRARLQEALRGLAFRPDAFEPFVGEMAVARQQAPVARATYAGTPLGAKLNALVLEQDGGWLVLTPLSGVAEPAKVAAALAAQPGNMTQLVDLKQVSSQMVDGYRRAALGQVGWGVLLILVLLALGLRSVRRTLHVAAPAGAALVLTVAVLVASGQRLGVFHLVALLLVLGIGLNYALFFERPPQDVAERGRTALALAVCSISTIATFGFLALSATPVLHAIGSTVALGALLSLVFAALWARAGPAVLPLSPPDQANPT